MYWAIAVDFGDVVPQTVQGKVLASAAMILGYGIIAVPTGIVTVELSRQRHGAELTRTCNNCAVERHDIDAKYCKHCGAVFIAAG